jgi:hypothetical protein
MGPRGCPKTSVRNYRYTVHNNPEERSTQVYVYSFINLNYEIFFMNFLY